MKAIDRRKNERKDKFKVGDVVCYYDDGDSKKYYAMITHIDNIYALIDLVDDNSGEIVSSNENAIGVNTVMNNVINDLSDCWDHVEKVNTRLVIVD